MYLLFLLACPLLPLPKCPRSKSQDAVIAAQIGVQRLDGMLPYRAMRLVMPDLLMLAVAGAAMVYVCNRRLVLPARQSPTTALATAENNLDHSHCESQFTTSKPLTANTAGKRSVQAQRVNVRRNKRHDKTYFIFTRSWNESQRRLWRAWAMDSLRMLITLLLVCFAGITSPSLPSAVYLLSFLAICTYWACRNDASPSLFASLRIFLVVYSGLHVCLYYLYQFPFFQEFCKDGGFLARLLGLYYIMRTSCDRPGEIIFPTGFRIVDCLAPPITMLLYYVLVLETRRWLDGIYLLHNNASNSEFPTELWCNNLGGNVSLCLMFGFHFMYITLLVSTFIDCTSAVRDRFVLKPNDLMKADMRLRILLVIILVTNRSDS
ncbi:unnamed protein product [Trichobilharzia regenti]|nr:unnamed protein product [Trichobilharzia regenti]